MVAADSVLVPLQSEFFALEGLTQLMNRFLTVLSDAILSCGGTIDKFMGDAVMAFWNAPLDHDKHAHSACKAALRMLRTISSGSMVSQSKPSFVTRYGLYPSKVVAFKNLCIMLSINAGYE